MYEENENGEKKWKSNGNLLENQLIYQKSIEEQFKGINKTEYEIIPPTVGWMFLQPCNFRCSYCFAVFNDLKGTYLTKDENLKLCELLSKKFQKITLLGGEPTLSPYLHELLEIAKSNGCTTSIITNGYRLTDENYVKSLAGFLDWITISIDSASPEIQAKLGRGFGPRNKPNDPVQPLSVEHYLEASRLVHKYGIKLKISTVVNQLNKDEDMSEFILAMKPLRWKLFQCLYLEGENSGRVEHLLINKTEMESFISRHEFLIQSNVDGHGIALYSSNEDTKNGYACITPSGTFLDDNDNKHKYSRSILEYGVDEAWKDIDYKPENFRRRGGHYNWADNMNNNHNKTCERDIEDIFNNQVDNKVNNGEKKLKGTSKKLRSNFDIIESNELNEVAEKIKEELRLLFPYHDDDTVNENDDSVIKHRCPEAELYIIPNILVSLAIGTVIAYLYLRY